jgi:hypothetical protein
MKSKNIDHFLKKIYDPIKDFEDQILGKKYGSDRQIYDYKITIASLEVGEDEFIDRGHEEYQLRLKKLYENSSTPKKRIYERANLLKGEISPIKLFRSMENDAENKDWSIASVGEYQMDAKTTKSANMSYEKPSAQIKSVTIEINVNSAEECIQNIDIVEDSLYMTCNSASYREDFSSKKSNKTRQTKTHKKSKKKSLLDKVMRKYLKLRKRSKKNKEISKEKEIPTGLINDVNHSQQQQQFMNSNYNFNYQSIPMQPMPMQPQLIMQAPYYNMPFVQQPYMVATPFGYGYSQMPIATSEIYHNGWQYVWHPQPQTTAFQMSMRTNEPKLNTVADRENEVNYKNQHHTASIDGLKESELNQGKLNSLINDFSLEENRKIEKAINISGNDGNQETECSPLKVKHSADMAHLSTTEYRALKEGDAQQKYKVKNSQIGVRDNFTAPPLEKNENNDSILFANDLSHHSLISVRPNADENEKSGIGTETATDKMEIHYNKTDLISSILLVIKLTAPTGTNVTLLGEELYSKSVMNAYEKKKEHALETMEKASNDNDNDLVEASGESVMSQLINGQNKLEQYPP